MRKKRLEVGIPVGNCWVCTSLLPVKPSEEMTGWRLGSVSPRSNLDEFLALSTVIQRWTDSERQGSS